MQERLGAFRCGLVPQLHGKTGGRLRGRRGLRLHRIVWGHDRLAHGFRFAAGAGRVNGMVRSRSLRG